MNTFYPIPYGFINIVGLSMFAYTMYRTFTEQLWARWVFNLLVGFFGAIGLTAGGHRLWSHRSYSAKLPLRIFLMLAHTCGVQGPIYGWSVGHRLHHKYSETDADPNNPYRGLFYAHIGWILKKEHPNVSVKEKKYNNTDLLNDPVVMFQKKYYWSLVAIFFFILPIAFQIWCLGDDLFYAFAFASFRQFVIHHITALINSWAHLYGDRPYDADISPVDNFWVHIATMGEGNHNFHHAFPYDYRSGNGSDFSATSLFIKLMFKLGFAHDLKVASDELIKATKLKTLTLNNNHLT
jgi:stearoyl-CoA desaturase (delta-9 desaturase)